MAKILYISHYEEPSGWGQAARDYILAMDSVGLDIVIRSVRPNKSLPAAQIPDRIKEIAKKSIDGATICIQNLLPHLMDYNGRFEKNIGQFVVETLDWEHCGWHDYLNQMDEVWVPNTSIMNLISKYEKYRTKIPFRLIPHACDISKYSKQYDKLNIPNTEGNYLFYFIGEFNRRKHISALIRAYFMAFTHNDPVTLVLKVNKHGMNPHQIYDDIIKMSNDIKQSHKLYMRDIYPHIVIIPNYMSEDDICKLHNTCNCFVNPSFGEAWSIPTFDAMGFNKKVISGNWGGPADFLTDYSNKSLIGGYTVPVFGMTDTFPQMNTARERWFDIDIPALSKRLASSYRWSDRVISDKEHIQNSKNLNKYSYHTIGNRIKELLCI